jgi:hypothetical protein
MCFDYQVASLFDSIQMSNRFDIDCTAFVSLADAVVVVVVVAAADEDLDEQKGVNDALDVLGSLVIVAVVVVVVVVDDYYNVG